MNQPKPTPKAIITGFNHIVADIDSQRFDAAVYAIREVYGKSLTEDDAGKIRWVDFQSFLSQFCVDQNISYHEEKETNATLLYEEKLIQLIESTSDNDIFLRGAREFFTYAKFKGLKLGVVTIIRKQVLELLCERAFQMPDFFDSPVLTPDNPEMISMTDPKDPSPYTAFLQQNGVDPRFAIGVAHDRRFSYAMEKADIRRIILFSDAESDTESGKLLIPGLTVQLLKKLLGKPSGRQEQKS
jgi:phosphoglycolate phosphatase-like HAD superfamily hydrolase